MSGECGYRRLEYLEKPGKLFTSEEVAKSASATLAKLNSLMKQVSDWRHERLVLESNVRRLRSALENAGQSPDEALKPDPLLVHQREEINRLELSRDRLEDKVRRLRVGLLEADQVITCSGAKRLRAKMSKMREEAADERRKFNDEIGYLKLRVQEAEDDSSCSGLNRLRKKLREILKGDKKIERIIADVALRSCGTVIDLSNELTRIKELVDRSSLENIKLNRENRRLIAALESAPNAAGCSEYLETIERLGNHVKELERKIKEFEDDPELVKRVGELENELYENRKEAEDRETVITSLRNEILGAKTALKIKSLQLSRLQDADRDAKALEGALKDRDERLTDLQQRLKLSTSITQDMESMRNELNRIKPELLNLEIERDGLSVDIEKMRGIVSDRNDQIVKILTDYEEREKARRSEIEDVRTKLCIASVDNDRLQSRCDNLEEERDCNAPLVKKIKELEEELVELKRHSCIQVKKDLTDANSEVKHLAGEVNTLKGSKVTLEKELSNVGTRMNVLGSELQVERSTKEASLEESKNFKRENDALKAGKEEAEKLVTSFIEQVNELKSENSKLRNQICELEEERNLLKNINSKTDDHLQDKLIELQARNDASGAEFEKLRVERDTLKDEFRELSSSKSLLNNEFKKWKMKFDQLTATNTELERKLINHERLEGKLEGVRKELEESLEELKLLKQISLTEASFDNLKLENEELKNSLKKEKKENSELIADVKKLRSKVEEQLKTLQQATNKKADKFSRVSKTEDSVIMDCGDYLRADRELKYYIHLQSLAVKRIVDFINYLDGTTSLKPTMATFLEPTITNLMVLKLDENLTATFRMSQKLSEKIFQAEINVQRLETMQNERNNLITEGDCLNKGMEKLSKMNFGQEVQLKEYSTSLDNKTADNVPWLQNNILVLRRPYEVTSPTFDRGHFFLQPNDPEDVDEKFLAMNRRVSALQKQITLKQHEAGEKLIEMRETMRQERIRLMEIADRANVPRSDQLGAIPIDDRTF